MTPLQCAIADLGVTEWPRNSNKVKFNDWYYGREVSGDSYPWCMTVAQYWYNAAGMPLPFKTASCSALLAWYKANQPECIVKEPQANDIAIYSFGHVGIVESATGDTITCIEGNTSATSASNGGEVMRCTRKKSLVSGFIRPLSLTEDVRFATVSGVNMMFGRTEDFRIVVGDVAKRNFPADTYANAGFFATASNGETAPITFLKADNGCNFNTAKYGGTIKDGKVLHGQDSWDTQFGGKVQTVVAVQAGECDIFETGTLPAGYDYVVAGIPIMRNGEDVSFEKFVKPQGWTGGELYATRHIFVGVKDDPEYVYVMEWKSATGNMILSAEAFKKFKALGFREVVKLDGGGSAILVYDGECKASTTGNRRCNSFITFTRRKAPETDTREVNPYGWPEKTIKYSVFNQGDAAKSIQWALTKRGYDTGGVDGWFWTKSVNAVKAFQKAENLDVDGIVGPQTRTALQKYFK